MEAKNFMEEKPSIEKTQSMEEKELHVVKKHKDTVSLIIFHKQPCNRKNRCHRPNAGQNDLFIYTGHKEYPNGDTCYHHSRPQVRLYCDQYKGNDRIFYQMEKLPKRSNLLVA